MIASGSRIHVPLPQVQAAIHPFSFNPTLVRLRQGGASARRDALPAFNPTLVRLRLLGWRVMRLVPCPFNPTLVRLRQPGTSLQPTPATLLSIPPWFDCGGATVVLVEGPLDLSIPPWFDCGKAA